METTSRSRYSLYTVLLLILSLFASACESTNQYSTTATPIGTYRIDPIFWEYYNLKGGAEVFGPAITNLFTFQGKKMQYLENGLLVFDYQSEIDPYSFAPLGETLNFYEPPEPTSAQQGDLIINSYPIHPDFVNLYNQLGADTVGEPLTNLQINYAQNRIEQHFQNLGFYSLLDDPLKEILLLAYGLADCGPVCQKKGTVQNAIIARSALSQPFATAQYQLGVSATGEKLMGPIDNVEDGREEVIFENIVLYNDNGRVFPRPILLMLGYEPQPLVGSLKFPNLVFIPVTGNLGHNVPIFFHEYIVSHGRYEISGLPITEFLEHDREAGIGRQCFTNLCLEYHTHSQEEKVRPVPLGIEYLNKFYPHMQLDTGELPSSDGEPLIAPRVTPQPIFLLQMWESSPLISSSDSQTIYASVSLNGMPQAHQQLTLTISIPNALPQSIDFPETTDTGQTALTLTPIVVPNGTLISLLICLNLPEGASQCISSTFLIWGNP
ncbi:MAG: hypothetical protein E3J88_05090 [Anaerolineales bacterium]|nr:MAG: hypothetical protein E3J88_05090 [Anaerolineales bacterium]